MQFLIIMTFKEEDSETKPHVECLLKIQYTVLMKTALVASGIR